MYHRSAVLTFPKSHIDKPHTSHIVRAFDVEVTIMHASITPVADGQMFAIFKGDEDAVEKAFDYLRENEVRVILPEKNLIRDEEKCTHCSACVGQCFSGAFTVDKDTHEVVYDGTRCIACGLCIEACSYGAIESVGDQLKRTGAL
ncbi:MAG: 4Fe-4S dicluster domain-containing protein [Proteobacteria bacterium]|nr:4Fe-4S dicluster domain-containing protein [Pseudomonadota bacterium]